MAADEGPRINVDASILSNAAQIHAVDLRLNEKIIALDRVMEEKLEAQSNLVNQRAESAERAIAKVEVATEKRFENVNEFRGQLKDQAATFMSRVEIESRFNANVERITRLESSRDNLTGRFAMLGLALSFGLTVVGLIFKYIIMGK